MAKCSICGRDAVAYIRYQRRYLCREHYIEFVENKVRRSIKRYKLLSKGSKVLVSVSGGKDSAALLMALSRLSKEYQLKLYALHINLGIGEYSEKSLRASTEAAKMLRIPLIILNVKDLIGYTIPELARRLRRPVCSVCGLVKRYLINAVAVELGADAVALGHNADDLAVYSMKSFITQDLEYLDKLGPKTENIQGIAVGRIRPLYEVYEKESFLYAFLLGVPFIHDECPHVNHESLEQILKVKLNEVEEKKPGMKIMMLRNMAKRIRDLPRREYRVQSCRYCGLLSSTEVCSFCRMTARIHGEPLGPIVRSRVRELVKESESRQLSSAAG
ncbi:MAG: adenine nucleotide alpha hydrolase family protein [Desulfurococcales archaeon]|nr:adenine nucleotide alpha hydrolase family protein [Desulfurococcales archaeon]